MGGALSFKGDKKKPKKKKSKPKHDRSNSDDDDDGTTQPPAPNEATTSAQEPDVDDDLTEAERKALGKKRDRERQELEKVAKKSHRERIEEFNHALASVTELNDIPRVSPWWRTNSIAFIRSCHLMVSCSSTGERGWKWIDGHSP